MLKVVITTTIFALIATVSARMAYQLSSGYEDIVGQPAQTFTCDNRAYGYYADVDNDCRIFHVCLPIVDEVGETLSTDHFSFMCGNQTVFNQESLTCTDPIEAFPCDQAATLYDVVNAEFGRIPEDSDYQV